MKANQSKTEAVGLTTLGSKLTHKNFEEELERKGNLDMHMLDCLRSIMHYKNSTHYNEDSTRTGKLLSKLIFESINWHKTGLIAQSSDY